MRQWLSLLAVAALLAGCAAGPQAAPIPSQNETSTSETAPDHQDNTAPDTVDEVSDPDSPTSDATGVNPDRTDETVTRDEPATGGADAPPATPVQPPAEPAPSTPSTSDLLSGMVRVPAPALASLPESLQQYVYQISPWAAAELAAVWRHGVHVVNPLAVAPALADQLSPLSNGPDQVWTKLISSWDEGDRFYFHVQMTRRDADGRMVRAGIDVVEVSQLENGAPLVTGYAHAPWSPDPNQGSVTVWVGRSPTSYIAPQPVRLPAPVVVDAAGQHQVPAAVLESLGTVEWLGNGSVTIGLAPGSSSEPMATTTINGVAYVAVDDLIAALDGKHYASSQGSATYAVEWRPDLGQLCLWQDLQHPIS